MPELPPIRQKVIVDVEGDRAAAQKIGGVSKATDDLTDAQDRNAESSRILTTEQRKLLDARIQAGRQQRGFIRNHQLERKEIDSTTAALATNNQEQKRQTSELKKLTSGFKAAGSAAQLFALFIGLIKWPAMAAGAGLATSAISALAAGAVALVGTLGPMLNLIGLVPAALAAAGGGIGALLIGTRGIGEAIGAGFADKPVSRAAKKDPVDEARKQEDALRAVERAQESLSDSQRDATRAQEALNKAWLDARNNLRDLREEQTRGTNSVARAEIALTRARERQKELSEDDEATAEDRREALIDISDAELDLLDAQQKRTSNARDLAEAEAKGVAGSDAVTEAQEAVADSQQAVIDNTLELKRAIEDVGRALKDTGTPEVDKFAEAMKDLGPEAREFVNTLVGNKSLLKGIKRDVGEALFAPINEGMKTLLGNAPAFTSFLTQSASGIGNIGKSLLDAFGDKGIAADFEKLGEGNKAIFDSIAQGMKPLVKIFTDLAVVGQPFVKEILDLAVGGLQKFSDKIAAMRADGSLAELFRRGLDTAKQFGRILRDLVVGVSGVFKAAAPLGQSLLDSLENIIKRFRDFTQSFSGQTTMQTFFANQKPILHEIAELMGDIFGLWFRLANTNAGPLTDLIQRLRVEGLPILEKLLTSVGPNFINNIVDLAFALGNLFSTLFGETGPMSVFLEVFSGIFEVINDLLTTFPILKTFIFYILAMSAAFKAIKLAGAITGINGLIGVLRNKTLQSFLFGSKETFAAAAVPSLFARIGGAAASAGGGITGLVTALGPYAIAVGAAVGVGAALYFGWQQLHRRGDELKKTVKDVKAALDDANNSVEEAIELAAQKRISDKNQQDDLKRVGIEAEDIAKAAVERGESIVDLRRKLVESGEVSFKSLVGNPADIEAANDAYIRTGEVIDGVTVSNAGLVNSVEDIEKAAQKAATEILAMGHATGDITPELGQAALQWDLQNQGLLGFIREGPNAAKQLQFIKDKQDEANRSQERAIELIDIHRRKLSAVTDVAGNRITRDRSAADAAKAVTTLTTAEQKLADLVKAGKGETEEGKAAQEEVNTARQDANLAAIAYSEANARLAESEAELTGKTFGATEAAAAQQEAFKALGGFVSPESSFRSDIDTLIADFDTLFQDRSMTVNVHSSPDLGDWLDGLRAGIGEAVTAGFTGGLLGVVNLPQQIGAAAAAVPKPKPIKPPGPASAIISAQRSLNSQGLETGGIIATGSGFMTTGPMAVVGEGKRQFPEFVIPTDPAHRQSALGLIGDLVKRLGGGLQGGGVLGIDPGGILKAVLGYNQQQLAAREAQMADNAFQVRRRDAWKSREAMEAAMFAREKRREAFMVSARLRGDSGMDFGGMRIMAGQMDMGGTSRTITQGDTITGDHIGTSIGNEWRFEEGAIQVKDWEGAKAQLARDERLRNMTRAAGARSR